MDSFPNKSFNTVACSDLSRPLIASSTSRIAPFALVCMRFDMSTALKPSFSKAAAWESVAPSPATIPSMKFLIPVAATSDLTPVETIDAPSAAISPDATPPTSPSGPMRVTTSEILSADAAVVFPR